MGTSHTRKIHLEYLKCQNMMSTSFCGFFGTLNRTNCIFDITNLVQHARNLHPTKRNLVSLIGKFYDPLGLLSPVIIKLLIQKLYKSDWDQVISEDVAQEWKSTITDLAIPVSTSLPRCYLCETTDHLEALALCGFCDASTRALSASS